MSPETIVVETSSTGGVPPTRLEWVQTPSVPEMDGSALFRLSIVNGSRIRLIPKNALAASILHRWLVECISPRISMSIPARQTLTSDGPKYHVEDPMKGWLNLNGAPDEAHDRDMGELEICFHPHGGLTPGGLGGMRHLTPEQHAALLSHLDTLGGDGKPKPKPRKRGPR